MKGNHFLSVFSVYNIRTGHMYSIRQPSVSTTMCNFIPDTIKICRAHGNMTTGHKFMGHLPLKFQMVHRLSGYPLPAKQRNP